MGAGLGLRLTNHVGATFDRADSAHQNWLVTPSLGSLQALVTCLLQHRKEGALTYQQYTTWRSILPTTNHNSHQTSYRKQKSIGMLLFPPSSIPEPLRDSTNGKCLDRSAGSWTSTSRKSCYLTDLAISEVGSSDTSIYNASRAPSHVSDLASDLDHHSSNNSPATDRETRPLHVRAKSEASAQHDMVRFVNRPNGTPLFTIAEQRSLATLRTQISFASFKRMGPASLIVASSRKLKAASVDDTVLYMTRRGLSRNTQASSSLDIPSSRDDPVQPWQPPFVPPHRVKTPDGVPHWPVNARVSFARRMARTLSSATSLSPSEGVRLILRALSAEVRSRRRSQPTTWRPLVSGHSTYHYNQPSRHPLNNVCLAEVIGYENDRQDETQVQPIPEPTFMERQSLDRRCRSKSANASHAQRALGAIDGNAIPINPARAIRARSVSVPQRLTVPEADSTSTSPTHDTVQPDQSTAAYPSDTLRTIDMIESFPSPPSRLPTKRRDRLHFFAPVPQRAPFAHFLGETASTTNPSTSQD
jgi:hypothetical protein